MCNVPHDNDDWAIQGAVGGTQGDKVYVLR